MNRRIPTLDEFVNESFINESESVNIAGEEYSVDFIKVKSYDRHASPSYHLLLKNTKTGEILAWPNVFHYSEGWSQGTNRSERGWYLETQGYGGAGNGRGQSSPSAPRFINDQLKYIVDAYLGKSYSKSAVEWYQNNVSKFPKGTKKADIEQSLN